MIDAVRRYYEAENANIHRGVYTLSQLATNQYESAQAHPRVAPWRAQFKAMGLAPRDYRSSIEALMRRARGGGEPFRISPLVDFYNAVGSQSDELLNQIEQFANVDSNVLDYE